jgi:Cu/Ag efflux pump CusA
VIAWIVGSGLRFGRLVVAMALGVLAIGIVQLHGADVDVYPEFEPPAVEVQAEALGLSAQEVEQLITVPLEQDLLNGIPWVEHISSRSMPGLSVIELDFEPGTDLYEARQMVQERMTQAKALPNVGTPPIMIQPTASTSRVAMIGLTSKTVSTMQMSVLARWQIRPRLMSIPGVANVSVWGQRDRQLQVHVDPDRLRTRQVSLTELIESTGNALWVSPLSFVEASTPGTGGFLETPNQRLGVQHVQPITTADQLADVTVEGAHDPPLRIGDVATVAEDHQPLIGDASAGRTPGLLLVVERFPDADTTQVTRDVEAALDAMTPGLTGIIVEPRLFRPATYFSVALGHLGVAGVLALVLFLAVLGSLLRSWRAAAITAVSVPLSLTAAAFVLHLRGETLTTMTLVGLAAAVAVVVDDSVSDVSDVRRRLRSDPTAGEQRATSVVGDVLTARRGPLIVAAVVVLLALTPLLLAGGVTGALARPAIVSFALALASSLVVAVLVTPALAVLLLSGHESAVRVSPFDRWVHRAFDRIVAPSMGHPVRGLLAAALLAGVAVTAVSLAEPGGVLPPLQDRNVLVRLQAAPGTSLTEMYRVTNRAAAELRGLDGVVSTAAQVGRAITADEVVDVDAGQIWLQMAPNADYSHTLDVIRATVRGYVGLRSSVKTYAQDRIDVARGDAGKQLVVRVYGNDLPILGDTARNVREVLGTISGVQSPSVEVPPSEPTVEIQVDLTKAQRFGLRPGDVRREASTLVSGLTVGSLYEQQKIFDVVVWGGRSTRQSISSLESLLIDTPSGGHVRLGEVARVGVAPNPAAITHHAVSRSLDVTATILGRGAEEVADDVTERLRGVSMPYEYRAEVLTDAADRESGNRQLALLVLVLGLVVFLVLQAATRSWRAAAVLVGCMPLALAGCVLVTLFAGSLDSVGVLGGIGAVLALSLRQSLVLVRRAGQLRREPIVGPSAGVAARELAPSVVTGALLTGAVSVPPVFMGVLPGLELLHPLALTVLGGLVSSTMVVLFLVPLCLGVLAPDSLRPRTATARAAHETEVPQ